LDNMDKHEMCYKKLKKKQISTLADVEVREIDLRLT